MNFSKVFNLVLVLGLVLVLVTPVMAQEPAGTFDSPVPVPTEEPGPGYEWPSELPETAQEGLQVLVDFIAFVSSLLAMYATRLIRRLPVLNDGEKSKITGLAADAVAAVTSLLIGFVLAYGAYAANFLDSNGFWQVLVYVFPLLWGMHKVKKLSGVGKLVPILLSQANLAKK